MTAADLFIMHNAWWQAILWGVAFMISTVIVLSACCFVGVLFLEHFRTWRKRPAYRRALVSRNS